MNFSQGQIEFAIFFVCIFAVALIWSYKRDRPTNRKYYTGIWKILLTVILIFAAMSFILRHIHLH